LKDNVQLTVDTIIGQRLKNYRCSIMWIFVEANGQLKQTLGQKVTQFIVNDNNTATQYFVAVCGGKFHLFYVTFVQLLTAVITELQHVTWSAN